MRFPRMSGNAWVCTIITAILILSGAEQAVRALHPPPPTPPVVADAGLKAGDVVPQWSLPDAHGKTYTLAQFKGKPVVVNFYCGCNRCKEMAKLISGWQKKNHIPMVGLVTFKPSYNKEFREATGVDFPLLIDEGKAIGKKWNSEICPRVWVVDAKGQAVFTNPPDPEVLPAPQTVQMVQQAFAHPVAPAPPATPVAGNPPRTAG